MIFNTDTAVIIVFVLLYVIAMLILRVIIRKLSAEEQQDNYAKRLASHLDYICSSGTLSLDEKQQNDELRQCFMLESDDRVRQDGDVKRKNKEMKAIKGLHSRNILRRKRSATELGLLAGDTARLALEQSLKEEKDYSVRLYMANVLSDIGDARSLPCLVNSLIGSHRWYRNKVNMLIASFGSDFHDYLDKIVDRDFIEIKELIVDFSSIYVSQYLRDYLKNMLNTRASEVERLEGLFAQGSKAMCLNCRFAQVADDDNFRMCPYYGRVEAEFGCRRYTRLPVSIRSGSNYMELVYKAADVMSNYYFKDIVDDLDMYIEDDRLRNSAIAAMSNITTKENIDRLVSLSGFRHSGRAIINALAQIIERNPVLTYYIADKFILESDIVRRDILADVLSGKIEYFIMRLVSKDKKKAAGVIKNIFMIGKTSDAISFLNKNGDLDLENELVEIIREAKEMDEKTINEFCLYLDPRIMEKCGLMRCAVTYTRKESVKDINQIRTLYSIMLLLILAFPILYLLRHFPELPTKPLLQHLKAYVIDFNYYLAFYSVAINTVYLSLLVLSYINVRKQSGLWRLKNITTLFKARILPSISIIAPAYNEEKTIIESANSLLNLKYPDYELIIVNDGSKDDTLHKLIRNFELVKVDYIYDERLQTAPVRGIYINRVLPRLIVVDKENAGKADSLNTGINISRKEYFCGIDADSLLESDALLKLASLTMDEAVETPALGGNVFPVNGCKVDRGMIEEIHLPGNRLARMQTVEYIRAFMAGRMGWAYLNSLLIISGAFGLFRRERIIGVGGYLTSKGKYGKDTVGEDMELVVRISRMMHEMNLKFRICYAFNANCWTEVPEDIHSLKTQRYRWHRGLIDILTFHKKMLFNSAYGRTGMFALPYFFIFEMIGPLIEIQGYIMVIIAIFMGLLNVQLALFLFIATVLMGVLISLTALFIAEYDENYYSLKDIFIMIAYAIAENFGPRQIVSFWRVGGYIGMMRGQQGWGKVKRKGYERIEATEGSL